MGKGRRRRAFSGGLAALGRTASGFCLEDVVTLRDSADAADKVMRLPKSLSFNGANNGSAVGKAILLEDEDKDTAGSRNGGGGGDPDDDDDDVNDVDDDKVKVGSRTKKKKRPSAGKFAAAGGFSGEKTYPYCVWELIGNHIGPESVSAFGAVCRNSYEVVNRPHFWLRLHRDLAGSSDRPSASQPLVTTKKPPPRLQGLKAAVVKDLFVRHPLFVSRPAPAYFSDPHCLEGLTCINQVVSRSLGGNDPAVVQSETACSANKAQFLFKFCQLRPVKSLWRVQYGDGGRGQDDAGFRWSSSGSRDDDDDDDGCGRRTGEVLDDWRLLPDGDDDDDDFDLDGKGDIHANPEEHNSLLVVEAASLSLITQCVMGLKLGKVHVTVSCGGKGFRYHKLTLSFTPQHVGPKQVSSEEATVVIEDVVKIRVLKWYHPNFASTFA